MVGYKGFEIFLDYSEACRSAGLSNWDERSSAVNNLFCDWLEISIKEKLFWPSNENLFQRKIFPAINSSDVSWKQPEKQSRACGNRFWTLWKSLWYVAAVDSIEQKILVHENKFGLLVDFGSNQIYCLLFKTCQTDRADTKWQIWTGKNDFWIIEVISEFHRINTFNIIEGKDSGQKSLGEGLDACSA